MANKLRVIFKSAALVSFSTVVLIVFRFYSMLRPATCGALYKEWLSGGIVLTLCYLNYFVLYPRFYVRRRFIAYVLVTIISAIMATFLEVILVYPQINEFIKMVNETSQQEYWIVVTISFFLRDMCFVFFFFLISLLESAYEENKDVNILLQDTSDLLLARTDDKKRELVTIRMADIAYCLQKENYAYFFLADGTTVYRNCSLKSLYEQLTSTRVVRISRRIFVFYRHIVSYNNNSIYVKASNNDIPVGFEITDTFRQQALQLLKEHCVFAGNQPMEPVVKATTVDVLKMTDSTQQVGEVTDHTDDISKIEKPQTIQQVLVFISAHPGCKNPDIAERFRISQSTVNRILKQLKADGLITYEGSKKTGGYRVVSS